MYGTSQFWETLCIKIGGFIRKLKGIEEGERSRLGVHNIYDESFDRG